jgi:endoglucanase
MQPAPDGAFDDFEDGNNQVQVLAGRAGYWWVAHADHATIDVPGAEFRTSDGGPAGSKKAAHFSGKTDSQDQWGAGLGGNFLGGGFYDASKYAGVSFKIKGTAKSFVRFKIPDQNTHPDAGVCTQCWNSFGKTLELTGDWQTIELAFADLRQIDGWGSPRPASLLTSKVKDLEWAVDQGTKYDFWVDDVQLLTCK